MGVPGKGVEYREFGRGPTIVFVPGSCSTGMAWRSVVARLPSVRAVTTSLSGYGGTEERRTAADHSIVPVVEALEDAIDRAGPPVHVVGHSFGGLVALAAALCGRHRLLSLTILEAPAPGALDQPGDAVHLAAFRNLTDAYSEAHHAGDGEAFAAVVDFYGGRGS